MKRNTPRSPKVRDLAKRLGVPRYAAIGLLELLWHATAQLAPRGNIGSLDDDHIAEELCWDGPATALIDAMVESRWLDRCAEHRLVVHDWPDHCDQAVKRSKPVMDQLFAVVTPIGSSDTSSQLVSDERETSVPVAGAGIRLPEPEPSESPAATPWAFIAPMLSLDASPPATPGEREAWLDAVGPELEAAVEVEGPGDAPRERNARMKRIAFARWRTYCQRTERVYAGSVTAEERADMRAFEAKVAAEDAARAPPSEKVLAAVRSIKQMTIGARST